MGDRGMVSARNAEPHRRRKELYMQSEQTPRQPEGLHPDDFRAHPADPRQHQQQQRQRIPRGFGAGECGDAIWECAAAEGETVEVDEASQEEDLRPAVPETSVRGGRLIDLERRGRRE
jgi:hypothetical protein